MFDKSTFENKIALVTGGRSGIGYAISKQLLTLGAKVIICSRKSEPLKTAEKELSAYGEISSWPCDIRETEQINNLAENIKDKYGKLDVLVNNAGGQFPALAEHINDKGWNAVINNNLNGTFYMTREMAKYFFIPQKQGVIVNIIVDMLRGFPGMIHTGAARAGVENMTKTLAQEWSEYNIRINCVAPGIIESSGLENYPPELHAMFDKAKEVIPLHRFGSVEEVSNVVCFYASDLSSYVTGTSLYVDGAQHLNYDGMGLARAIKKMMEQS
jgi:citronellol/citronellal dehydrogenase